VTTDNSARASKVTIVGAAGGIGSALTPLDLARPWEEEALGEITQFYMRWASLGLARTTMWSTANGVARLVELLTQRQAGLCTASLFLAGEYGFSDVSLGMPVRIRDGAIAEIVQWAISASAVTKLRAAAEVICCQAATLDHLPGSKSFARSDRLPSAPSVVGAPADGASERSSS
jgi:malate/lactate dehydrogenase